MSRGDHLPAVGTMLAKKYCVERLLGEGGMGYVLLAKHIQLETRVAIKCMLPHLAAHQEAAERFLREARIAASLTNPHVVRILDVAVDDEGVPFMAMEFLEGSSLESVLDARGRLPVNEAVRLGREMCLGLSEAHAKGIVHRDLKPANLFLVNQWGGGTLLKILDFGISKLATANTSLTRDDQYMGSPTYMAPEQMVSSKKVDHRADIWSTGVCLYRFLSGVLPFDSDNVWEVGIKVMQHEPVPLESICPDVPAAFADVVRRCLQKNPDLRFRSVNELREALEGAPPASRTMPGDTPFGGVAVTDGRESAAAVMIGAKRARDVPTATGSYPGLPPTDEDDALPPVGGSHPALPRPLGSQPSMPHAGLPDGGGSRPSLAESNNPPLAFRSSPNLPDEESTRIGDPRAFDVGSSPRIVPPSMGHAGAMPPIGDGLQAAGTYGPVESSKRPLPKRGLTVAVAGGVFAGVLALGLVVGSSILRGTSTPSTNVSGGEPGEGSATAASTTNVETPTVPPLPSATAPHVPPVLPTTTKVTPTVAVDSNPKSRPATSNKHAGSTTARPTTSSGTAWLPDQR